MYVSFFILVPIHANVKFSKEYMVHAQVIGVVLCIFPTFPIMYYLGRVYYYPGHPSNNISLVDLKCYFGSQNIKSEPL